MRQKRNHPCPVLTNTAQVVQNWPKIRAALNEFYDYHLEDTEVILFLIGGAWYFMADIGLRMLTPRELYRANGFPDDYKIDRDYTGREYGKTKQVARVVELIRPNRRINVPDLTAMVRAAAEDGLDICEYCQALYMCWDCIVKEWKENGK